MLFAGSYKPCTHPHPPTSSQNMSHPPKLTYMQSKKIHTDPYAPTPSQEKVTLTQMQPKKGSYAPTPTKKRSCPPTFTHTQPKKDSYPPHLPSPIQKMVTSSLEKVTHPHITEGKNVTCKTRDLYLKSIIFSQYQQVSSFLKKIPVHFFLLNTFEAAFESIVCLYVFNNQLTTYQKIEKCVKYFYLPSLRATSFV